MLNPKSNRLDYGSILSPPPNYQLDFAIGATYSLDLDALVGASISLGLSMENDSDLNDNKIFLLEALRSTADKVALFCESGQIKLPNKATSLYILLEEMVFQVTNSNDVKHGRYASFHPKTWLIRYVNHENDVLYRFAVLSRNLTFDRSWDLSFSMDGKVTDKQTRKNDPLIRFIEYLCEYSEGAKKEKMNEIAEELANVQFKLNSRIFEGFDFIVNGIDDANPIQNHHLFTSKSIDRLLIMSPFLSKDVMAGFNKRKSPKSKAILITRLDSLGQLRDENLDNFEFYALKDEVIDGESLLSEDSHQKQDIHAKMYVVEKLKYTDLYLGSLNASHNALNGNVEFMIKLWARKRRFNIDKLLKDMSNDGKDDPFKLVNIEDIKDDVHEGNNLSLVVKGIVRLNARAEVIPRGNDYDLKVEFDGECNKYDIEIKPLLADKSVKFSRRAIFENMKKVELSEFFVITVKKGEDSIRRVIKIPIDNLPQDRQKEVISDVVNDKTAFIRYVAFLLGDEYITTTIDGDEGAGGDGTGIGFSVQMPELYEKMLKAARYAPEKFKELEFLIRTLSGDNVVPEGFQDLYDTFKQVIGDE